MLYPEINKLRDAAGSRYYLVSMASKRARDIIDGSLKLDERITSNKPVSIAAEEIGEGLFTYKTIEDEDELIENEASEDIGEEFGDKDDADVSDNLGNTDMLIEGESDEVYSETEEIF